MRLLQVFGVLSLGALFGWGLLKGAGIVLYARDPHAELPPCFEVGAPFHHRFRPVCAGVISTPRGPVPLRVNEDGLREIARAHALSHPRRVAVIGDSFIEGWWSSQEQALGSLLTRDFPGTYFLNGGLRSTGPFMQAGRLAGIIEKYRPQGVIWLLNDTDALDDRFTCAITRDPQARPDQAELGVPEFVLEGWKRQAAGLLGNTAAGGRLRRRFYQEKFAELASGESSRRCGACWGVKAVKKVADDAGLPLLVFFLASDSLLPKGHYGGGAALRPELLDCLRQSGIQTHTAGPAATLSAANLENYVWEGDFHLNPEGMEMLAGEISPTVKAWLEKLPPTGEHHKKGSHGKRKAR